MEFTRTPDYDANVARLSHWADFCSRCGNEITGSCWVVQVDPRGNMIPTADMVAMGNFNLICNACAPSIPADFRLEDD